MGKEQKTTSRFAKYIIFLILAILAAILILTRVNTTPESSTNKSADALKLPNVQSSELDASRKVLTDKLDKVKAAVSSISVKPIYSPTPYKWVDYCYHIDNPPKPSPTESGVANTCSLDTSQYFAYAQNRCDVIKALHENKDIFFIDSLEQESCQNKPNSSFMLNPDINGSTVIPIDIWDKKDFLDYVTLNAKIFLPLYNGCPAQKIKMNFEVKDAKLYCKNQSKPIATDQIPSNTQTIIEFGILDRQYYEK